MKHHRHFFSLYTHKTTKTLITDPNSRQALQMMCLDPENFPSILSQGAMDAILGAMSRHMSEVDVLMRGVFAMLKFSQHEKYVLRLLKEKSGLLDLLLQTLKRHPTVPCIQKHIFILLSTFAEYPQAAALCKREDVQRAVVAGLCTRNQESDVMYTAVFAFDSLCVGDHRTLRWLKQGCLNVILNFMIAETSDAEKTHKCITTLIHVVKITPGATELMEAELSGEGSIKDRAKLKKLQETLVRGVFGDAPPADSSAPSPLASCSNICAGKSAANACQNIGVVDSAYDTGPIHGDAHCDEIAVQNGAENACGLQASHCPEPARGGVPVNGDDLGATTKPHDDESQAKDDKKDENSEGDVGSALAEDALAGAAETCMTCGKTPAEVNVPRLLRCSRCVLAPRYCSAACQKLAWPVHRRECNENPRGSVGAFESYGSDVRAT
jgi:hypothetical protein